MDDRESHTTKATSNVHGRHKIYHKLDNTLVKKVHVEQMKLPVKTWIKNIDDYLENMKGKPSLDRGK